MTRSLEEIFGPVLSVVRVDSHREGVELINANPYGTAIYTTDGAAARAFENQVEVAMVGVNVPIPVPMTYYSAADGSARSSGTPTPTARRAPTGVDLGFPQND